MAALPNPRHERFAQALADGKSQFEAHRIAGYKPHRGNASSLAQDKNILGRVAEILGQREEAQQQATQIAIAESGVSKAWVMERLREIAERCMQHEPVLDRKGEHVEVETPEGSVAKAYVFNSTGANKALELLGKEIGMFVERREVKADLNVNDERRQQVHGIVGELFEAPAESADAVRGSGEVVH
jgi:phage terminase small subunit